MPCYTNLVYGPSAGDLTPNAVTNVILPTTGKPKLVVSVVYAEDNVSVKWYEYTVTVDALIYNDAIDIEDEVTRIKNILSTPGLQLALYPVGLGKIPVINGTLGVAGTDYTPELSGGPFPVEVSVEPAVTNKAIHIIWKVVARIRHCTSAAIPDLVSLTSDVDFDVDENGNLSFVVTHTYVARTPINLSRLNQLAFPAIMVPVNQSFQGMLVRHKTDLSPDQRTAVITVTASEIPSDNAFHPFTTAVEATDTLSSGLRNKGEGLHNWNRTVSAKITLPPRVHKSWSWLIFQRILKERFKNLKQLGKDVPAPGGSGGTVTASTGKNWWLLLKMKITDHIYTRTTEFEFDYLISTSLNKLLPNSCIFNRVNHPYKYDGNGNVVKIGDNEQPEKLSNQWLIWQYNNGVKFDGTGEYRATAPIQVAQCLVSTEPPIGAYSVDFRPTKTLPLEDDPDFTTATSPSENTSNQELKPNEPVASTENPQNIPAGFSWVEYSNEFVIHQDNDNMVATYLQPTPDSYYKDEAGASVVNREISGFIINNRTSPQSGSFYLPEVINRGISTYTLRMKGYAIRVGHAIPVPVITSIGGVPVYRTGQARIVHKQIAPNEKTPVYLCMWDIPYAVTNQIESANVMGTLSSTGHPALYT